ncbi:MAG: hypothetical protein IKT79_09670, partial [Akkermansia sp.]|nr:hypothetical protein [Akkermansia sp.]
VQASMTARKVVTKGRISSAYFLDPSPWMHGRGAGGAAAKCPGLGYFWDFLGIFRLHCVALEGIILLSAGSAGRELNKKAAFQRRF